MAEGTDIVHRWEGGVLVEVVVLTPKGARLFADATDGFFPRAAIGGILDMDFGSRDDEDDDESYDKSGEASEDDSDDSEDDGASDLASLCSGDAALKVPVPVEDYISDVYRSRPLTVSHTMSLTMYRERRVLAVNGMSFAEIEGSALRTWFWWLHRTAAKDQPLWSRHRIMRPFAEWWPSGKMTFSLGPIPDGTDLTPINTDDELSDAVQKLGKNAKIVSPPRGASPNAFFHRGEVITEGWQTWLGNITLPLADAARRGDTASVNALVAAGALVDCVVPFEQQPSYSATPLFLALETCRPSCGSPEEPTTWATVVALLDAGADPNLACSDGFSPLLHAAYFNLVDYGALLVLRGARVDSPIPDRYPTLVDAAKEVGQDRPESKRLQARGEDPYLFWRRLQDGAQLVEGSPLWSMVGARVWRAVSPPPAPASSMDDDGDDDAPAAPPPLDDDDDAPVTPLLAVDETVLVGSNKHVATVKRATRPGDETVLVRWQSTGHREEIALSEVKKLDLNAGRSSRRSTAAPLPAPAPAVQDLTTDGESPAAPPLNSGLRQIDELARSKDQVKRERDAVTEERDAVTEDRDDEADERKIAQNFIQKQLDELEGHKKTIEDQRKTIEGLTAQNRRLEERVDAPPPAQHRDHDATAKLEAELADAKHRLARVETQVGTASQATIFRLEQELGAVDVWEQNTRVGGSKGKIVLGIGPTRNHSQPIKLTDATLDPKFRSLLDMVLLVGRLMIEPSEFGKIQTVYVINNGKARPHTDPKNLGLSHLINIGNHADATNPSAGALWTQAEGIRNTYYKMISFQAQDPHAVMPYEGTRYSLCYFRTFLDVSESLRARMNEYGFALAPSVKLEDHCHLCGKSTKDPDKCGKVLLCDGNNRNCTAEVHLSCLDPEFNPEDPWFCSVCAKPRHAPISDDPPVQLDRAAHAVNLDEDLNGGGRLTGDGLERAEEMVDNAQEMIDGASRAAIKREQPDDTPPPKRRRATGHPHFKPGDRVEAKWGRGWYPGRIEHATERGYEIVWDDGSANEVLARDVYLQYS